jgi:hypothetical protein
MVPHKSFHGERPLKVHKSGQSNEIISKKHAPSVITVEIVFHEKIKNIHKDTDNFSSIVRLRGAGPCMMRRSQALSSSSVAIGGAVSSAAGMANQARAHEAYASPPLGTVVTQQRKGMREAPTNEEDCTSSNKQSLAHYTRDRHSSIAPSAVSLGCVLPDDTRSESKT